jgi:transposase
MKKLNSKLSRCWLRIQGNLFPWLQEELGPLSKKQKQLITVLEVARVEQFIQYSPIWPGRPESDRRALVRAFTAKAVCNMSTTTQLHDRLLCDLAFRRICGWEMRKDVPSQSTFSRAFRDFANTELPQKVHAYMIQEYESPRIVGHISRDATAIEAREKAAKKTSKPEKQEKFKRGRPKKGEKRPPKEPTRLERQTKMTLAEMINELPKACDVGTKRNSKGYKQSWKGYKLHIDTADGDIPISAVLTSASVHDSQVALPLAEITLKRVTSFYDLMDAAYDAQIIRDHSASLGHVPLIDFNHRSKKDTRAFLPHEAERYKERSGAERVNARLKDDFGGRMVRVRGNAKVAAHLMFGLIALTADQLMRLLI